MTNDDLLSIVENLQQNVQRVCRQRPGADEAQIIHEFLARHNLTATEHHGILDEYRRKALERLSMEK